jgi:hypothetical protein
MAGIYDRMVPLAEDRVPVHLVTAAITLYAEGDFTKAQCVAGINNTITTALSGAEITDLDGLADGVDAAATLVEKLRYLNKIESYGLAVETGALTNEATFRTALGI